jgi:site-specific DNA-cytosine methylase/intein/homing endonuclease
VDNTEAITHLSLCSGYDGIGLGLRHIFKHVREVAHVEIEAFPVFNLVSKMEAGVLGPAPVYTDLKTFPYADFCGTVDILSAGFPCFTAGTLVLTRNGHTPIEDVRIGDEVLSHTGNWRRVLSTLSKREAPTRIIKGGGFHAIECTYEHPFYTRERYREWDGSDRKYIRKFKTPVWTDAKNLVKDTFVGQVRPCDEQDDNHSENFWWIIGRYLADGHRVKRNDRKEGSGRVVISVGKHKSDELRERIRSEFGTVSEVEERTTRRFHIVRNEFFKFTSQFGKDAEGKYIPGWVFGLDTKKLSSLLDGYLSGDGTKQGNGYRASTVSQRLAYSIAYLYGTITGCNAGVRLQKTANKTVIEGRTVNQRDYYVVDLFASNKLAFSDGAYIWKQVKTNEETGKRRTVYNLEVDVDNSYTVNNVIAHNCQPFSSAGKQQADQDPRHLFPFIKNGITSCQPDFVFLENVEGILSKKLGGDNWSDPKGTPVLLHVLRELERIGYEATWGIFSADQAGLSHQRKRIYILAKRTILSLPDLNSPVVKLYRQIGKTDVTGKAMEYLSGEQCERSIQERDTLWESEGKDRDTGNCGRDVVLANTKGMFGNECESDGRHCQPSTPKPRNQDGEGIEEVAYTNSTGLEGNECHSRLGTEGWENTYGRSTELGSTQVSWAGQHQQWWEPPRVVTDSGTYEIESQMDRMPNGVTCRVDYAELCRSCDNITDEIRMLGNGVCPQQAALAFAELFNKLL